MGINNYIQQLKYFSDHTQELRYFRNISVSSDYCVVLCLCVCVCIYRVRQNMCEHFNRWYLCIVFEVELNYHYNM